ncbi:hypothetical protein ED733_007575 [Metarhizium rileyi]|uniref:Uncharacterized protein n=1 Tax=Metarhizium rileyi (strain RCEF 4871) TaxID=1649241 RepID=A0A5C6GPK0_METRR|nr:hypothetical protein ED733_007575 [Metarhizium rileyi]
MPPYNNTRKSAKSAGGVNTIKTSDTVKVLITPEVPKAPKVPKTPKMPETSKTSKVSPKLSKVSKASKASKASQGGKGCKRVQARRRQSQTAPPRRAYVRQTFPLSNVRGSQEEAAKHPPSTTLGATPGRIGKKLKRLPLAPDHLLRFPQVNHRYLDSRGNILFDNRYELSIQKQTRRPSKPPTSSPKPVAQEPNT